MENEKDGEFCFHAAIHRATDIHVPLVLSSPTSSADGRLARLSYGKVAAKEMYPNINEAALMRKIDMRVIPILCLLFVLTFLDRVNIANAAVYGMARDLRLVGNQYNIALAIL